MRDITAVFIGLAFAACGAACAPAQPNGDSSATVEITASTSGPSQTLRIPPHLTLSPIRIRAGELTLWLEAALIAAIDPGRDGWLLLGRVSKDLDRLVSWVPDDAFGRPTLVSDRRFEIRFDGGHELNSLLSGLPIQLRITTRTRTGDARSNTALLRFAPRFERFVGASQIWVDRPMAPIHSPDLREPLRYRAIVRSHDDRCTLSAVLPNGDIQIATNVGSRRWQLDLRFEDLSSPAGAAELEWISSCAGAEFRKRANVSFAISEVGLTSLAPDDVWPVRGCTPDVWSCLASASTALEHSSCGTYRDVLECRNAEGCAFEPVEPLSLRSIDASALEGNRAIVDAACPSNGTWCDLASVRVFSSPACSDPAPDLAAIVSLLASGDRFFPQGCLAIDPLSRSDIESLLWFSGTQGGPELLDAIDRFVGSRASTGGVLTEQASCHNCTAFETKTILWYPEVRRVVGSSRVDLQACKLEYSIVSPK